MTERLPVAAAHGLLRRSLGVQRAYLVGLERLTAEYVAAMRAAVRGAVPREGALDVPRAAAAPPDPTILLEGVAGAAAAGGFLVENNLDHAISAPVCASPFVSAQGHAVDVRLQFEPEVVSLEPREQLLVRVGTRIDARLVDAGGCWGRLAVAQLPGTELVVHVRVAAGVAEELVAGSP